MSTTTPSIHLVNGHQTPQVSATARGLAYGDGLFETIRVSSGRAHSLNAHLQRLQQGCGVLHMPPPDRAWLQKQIDQLIPLATERAVLKLIWYRAGSARGYTPEPMAGGELVLSLLPWPEQIDGWQQRGLRIQRCRHRLGIQPALAGIKHLNRLDQVLASAELDSADEGILEDVQGRLVGGTRSNLFVVRDGVVLTPILDDCGVHGIMRAALMRAADKLGIPLREQVLYAVDLQSADELFMTNALMGVVSVTTFSGHSLSSGELTQALTAAVGG